MEKTLFKFIWRYSKRDQIILLILTAISFPFLYLSLDLPKTIINKAIGGKDVPEEIFGMTVDQIDYLLILSGAFLALVFVNGGFKFYVNVFRGQLGERMLRRLRYSLLARVLRFPLPQFKKVSQGEVIQMVNSEVEPLGGFVGDSIALPAFQGGTLLTILIFMFIQDWMLGLAAIALYPIQGYIIPKLQWHVNQLGKKRVRNVRVLAEKIGEAVSGIEEVHANDGARRILARFTERLGVIYDIRYEIFRRKFFIKFLNNFIAQLTPFFFYSIGGYLVIKGDLTFGALVAILAAYKDLSAPWKELLTYYQRLADSRIKYDQVIEKFDPQGIWPENYQMAEIEADFSLAGKVSAGNLSILDEESQPIVEKLSFDISKSEHIALTGPSSGGKDLATILMARLLAPDSGQIVVAGKQIADLPEAATGRYMGYIGPNAFVFNATLKENILLGAMHRPISTEVELNEDLKNAQLSGNSLDDLEAEWLDYTAIGVDSDEGLQKRLIELLQVVDLDGDVYSMGLRSTVDGFDDDQLLEQILTARKKFRERLDKSDISNFVESFDKEVFNSNASVAENLLFGTPKGDSFNSENIGTNAYVVEILERVGLKDEFIRIGRDVASTMVELFADLPSDHEYFSQYSFISSEDLPEFQTLLARSERLGLENMSTEDSNQFLSLPFKLIPARHRLDLITNDIQKRILEARKLFAEEIGDELRDEIEFFKAGYYNRSSSIQDNILFGKIALDKANAIEEVNHLVTEIIDQENLRPVIINAGLNSQAGLAGSRLSQGQRQKLSIARALLRRPDHLILNEATSSLDSGSQTIVMSNLLSEMKGRNITWALQRASLAENFDRVLVLSGGQVVEDGSFQDLVKKEDSVINDLLREE
ncbi:MAG: ABC transporter ATP-binding protein/permease [Pseudomonadota bacterium]|nr:ABC transporter ATP-binding protein/permease [Pseudomonadota bacterium]MEC8235607.1 ABC transporter ATP-binding protein/permease [Pseudomonadota bacterium]